MKRLLLGAVLVPLFVSCSQSIENKANVLIKEEIKKVLYHPETYDPAETIVDSSFTPFDDPIFYDKTLQVVELGMSVAEYERNMKHAKSTMSIFSGRYQSDYARNEYNEAKDEYEENAKNKQNAEDKARNLAKELKTMLDKERKFIGFKAIHSYRANNNAGQTVFGKMIYLFDKDMKTIVASYDMKSEEYMAVQMLYKQMLGEDVFTEARQN